MHFTGIAQLTTTPRHQKVPSAEAASFITLRTSLVSYDTYYGFDDTTTSLVFHSAAIFIFLLYLLYLVLQPRQLLLPCRVAASFVPLYVPYSAPRSFLLSFIFSPSLSPHFGVRHALLVHVYVHFIGGSGVGCWQGGGVASSGCRRSAAEGCDD
ncbi:hypothetical protein BDZ91DRAFT_98336 [Kalaharituber pfeilii]|nr:hypothetical protein BDZ91DRAFT_98336 [Kalaharituber pfeilii]